MKVQPTSLAGDAALNAYSADGIGSACHPLENRGGHTRCNRSRADGGGAVEYLSPLSGTTVVAQRMS